MNLFKVLLVIRKFTVELIFQHSLNDRKLFEGFLLNNINNQPSIFFGLSPRCRLILIYFCTNYGRLWSKPIMTIIRSCRSRCVEIKFFDNSSKLGTKTVVPQIPTPLLGCLFKNTPLLRKRQPLSSENISPFRPTSRSKFSRSYLCLLSGRRIVKFYDIVSSRTILKVYRGTAGVIYSLF